MKKHFYILMLILFCAAVYFSWRWVKSIPQFPSIFSDKKNNAEPDSAKTPLPYKTIKIGVIDTNTGIPAGVDNKLRETVQFAVDRINAGGGLLGIPVEAVYFDDKHTAIGARKAAEDAVKSGVCAVIGCWFSSMAIEAAKVFQEAKIPMITPIATNPAITKTGDYIFRLNYEDSFQGSALAEFAYNEFNARRVIIISDAGNIYSPYISDVFSEQFIQLGGVVLLRKEYIVNSGYSALVKEIVEHKSDLIFLPGYEKESADIIKEIRKKGVKTTILGSDGWEPTMLSFGGKDVVGSYYAKAWHPDMKLKSKLQYEIKAYEAKFGFIERDTEALCLDACYLLFDAIRRAETPTPEAIRNAIRTTSNFHGIVGEYNFTDERSPKHPLVILRFTEKTPEFVKIIEQKSINIAAIFAKTGDAALNNTMGFEASRYAVNEINNKGGILGHKINLLEYDNQSTALGSREAAEQAAADKVIAVIGASWSSHSSAMAPVLQNNKIIMLTPTSSNTEITRIGNFIFRMCFTDDIQGKVMADFAIKDLSAKNAVVLTNVNSEYSEGLSGFIKERFMQMDKKISEIDYLQNETEYADVIEKVKAAGPDVVFIPGYHRESAYLISQAKKAGIKAKFVGGDGWNDQMLYYVDSADLEGSFYTENWHITFPDKKSLAFVEKYSKTHQLFNTGFIALTYDSIYLLRDSIVRAKSFDTEKIRDALAGTRNFSGITGCISFNSERNPDKSAVILTFKNGSSEFYKTYGALNKE